jgi:hypothetical protein
MTFRREIRALVLASVMPAVWAQSKVARDWERNPAVAQVDTRADVLAIGDVHGDYDRLAKLLAAARVIDKEKHWSGGRSVVVFTGDLVDKGPKGPAVLGLLHALQGQAARSGGRVVVLMGNHEADFLRSPESEKAKEFALQLKDAGMDAKAVAGCAGELGAFLCGLPFAARVNDWFFSHAGNAGGRTMAQLIADLEGGVDRDGFDTAQLTDSNSLIQARLGVQGPGGKSWFAGEARLAAYEEALGVKHIVQGHQHNAEIFPDGKARKVGEMYEWRGRLFLIDVGMSQDIDESSGMALRIRAGGADAICPDGRAIALWDAAKADASMGVDCRK